MRRNRERYKSQMRETREVNENMRKLKERCENEMKEM
jgi:hypothetical protein